MKEEVERPRGLVRKCAYHACQEELPAHTHPIEQVCLCEKYCAKHQ